jgi:hypothetical protein
MADQYGGDEGSSVDSTLDMLRSLKREHHVEEPEPSHQHPTTQEVAKKAADVFSGNAPGMISEFLSDPRGASMAVGAGLGARWSGASFNPLNPNFMQYNPRYEPGLGPTPRESRIRQIQNIQALEEAKAALPQARAPMQYYETGSPAEAARTGASSAERALTSQVSSSSFNAPFRNIPEADKAALYHQTGPTKVVMLGGKPFEMPIGADIPASPAPSGLSPAAPASKAQRLIESFQQAVPGAKSTINFVKGAAPTVGTILKGAGTLGSLGDIGMRAIEGDKAGMGIAALGALAAGMANPRIGVPVALGALGANYLRDNPEMQKRIQEYIMMKAQKAASEAQAQKALNQRQIEEGLGSSASMVQ